MKKLFATLAAIALLAVAAPVLADNHNLGKDWQNNPGTCYDPNTHIDGSKQVNQDLDPWTNSPDSVKCEFFFGNQTILLRDLSLGNLKGSPDFNNDGEGDLDGTYADDVYTEAGAGEIFVLIGHHNSDNFNIHYYDVDGNELTWYSLIDGNEGSTGNTGGDEVGEVPFGASYAIVKMIGAGTTPPVANGVYDFFEVTNTKSTTWG